MVLISKARERCRTPTIPTPIKASFQHLSIRPLEQTTKFVCSSLNVTNLKNPKAFILHPQANKLFQKIIHPFSDCKCSQFYSKLPTTLAHLRKVYFPWEGGGVLREKLGSCVRPTSQNPYPTSDQNLRFSLPYFRPDQNLIPYFRPFRSASVQKAEEPGA